MIEHLKEEWGEVERAAAKDRRRRKLYEMSKETGAMLGLTILGLAMVCGVLAVAAIAPNIFSAFGRMGRNRRYFDKGNFKNEVIYLKRRGYINTTRGGKDNITEIRITDSGEDLVAKRALGNFKIIKHDKWDGIWRIVIFDIPERNKWAREGLRERLKRMGFYPLQKSTFVFPYPCQEEIEFLGRLYDISDHVRFIETGSISFDDDIKDFFSLKT